MHRPKHVVIVGGGTAGWLSAAYLASVVGKTHGLEITLVESPDVGIIGVGEATIPTLAATLTTIGVSEDEFLRNVNGAFKQAIRFQNWLHDPATKPTYFYHPFHKANEQDVVSASQYLYFHPDYSTDTYARLATAQTMACDANKAPGAVQAASEAGLTYAYHMDATLFGRFLRRRFEGCDVRRIEGHVKGALTATDGNLQAVVLQDGTRVEGDFFIDCSGFRGLLINQHLDVPFQSFGEWLPCDRALAVSVPYVKGDRIKPYTQATARGNGWIWDISLASRRGVGHVFSSAYGARDDAERSLREYLGASWPANADVREIDIRVGRCDRLWEKNCVAIGLSGGFIEPLESTGIYLIELGIKYLVDHWPLSGITDEHRKSYSHLMHDAYSEVLEFVFMHYYTSRREDTAFWRDFGARIESLPGDLHWRLKLWKSKFPSPHDTRVMNGNVFGHESLIAILAGMKWFEGVASPYVIANRAGLRTHLADRMRQYEAMVSRFPSHEDYLRRHGVSLDAVFGD